MSVMDFISQQLGEGQVEQIAKRLGASKEQTQSAIGMALPTLLGAVAKKAENDDGVAEIEGQLGSHDGSIFDSLTSVLGGEESDQANVQAFGGSGDLLGSILGGRKDTVESGIGKASGLQGGQVGSLMSMLAPMIMGAIGKKQRDEGMDRSGLGGMLKGERQQIEQQASGGLLAGLLDQDGDGDFDFSDVMQMGMKRFFGK